MKKLITILAAAVALFACCSPSGSDLTHWKMQREGDTRTYDAVVPCTVAGALNEAGVFGENILEQDRYFSIDKSIFDSPWIFTTTFKAQKGLNHVLRFEGIGYSADIWVNGKQIAAADTTVGVFCIREYDITKIAKTKNTLKVRVFKAPEKSLNNGYVDWNPRPVDESMGIWRKVELISTPDVRIADVFVKPVVKPEDLTKASFIAEATLINYSQKAVEGTLKGCYDSGEFETTVVLAPGETKTVSIEEPVDNPRIWWSHDLGTAELYTLNLKFAKTPDQVGGDAPASHSRKVRFGLRDIDSEIDEFGHRLFKLNGKPVLIKSAGWTDDIFMQDTKERTLKQLELVRNMNLNSVRFENIWSKDGAVYDLCDSLGLMAMVGWSCQWEWEGYCGYPEVGKYGCINAPETEALAVRYLHDQLLWMRNHPSVISWGMGSDRIPNERLEEAYMEWYNKLEYRPYICSSGGLASKYGGPSGVKMAGPYEYVGPEYWYLDTKHGGNYGFNTETGIGMNIPQAESVRKIVGEEHLWPLDRNWDLHCTVSTTDMSTPREATKAMTGLYGEPTGFEDFVRKAHALDYDGTRSMYEAFRVAVPRTTGIVQWMLNSAWPSLYWQQFDWYLVPTAGYYGTQKACEPVQLIYDYGDHSVWAVDEVVPEGEYTAVMKIYGPDSKLISKKKKEITIKPREPQKVFSGIDGPCFVALELRDHHDHTIADNFYCVAKGNNSYVWEKANWFQTPIKDYVDLSFVAALPETEVEMKTTAKGLKYKVTLSNKSDVIAYQNILKAKDANGELIPAAMWSDNFFSLQPGQKKTVNCVLPEGFGPATITMEGWNATVRQAAPDSLDRNLSAHAEDLAGVHENAEVGVIPRPVSMEVSEGTVRAAWFNTVYRITKDADIPAEGYTIDATGKRVIVEASDEAGLFYAKQTLAQLRQGRRIPRVKIVDYPRFEWRGWHIDPCRHFMSVADIKKQIDVMAQYKINVLHWHLTDDQGWRIEIKKYPMLTEVGGWRTEFDGSVHGGFYTQDEIREVVNYAAERFITVVPEIEMPGHAHAAIKAYPELSCTKEKVGDFCIWGSPDIVLCAGQDFTYEFLEDVIKEVVELFPSEYIHIGGDECQKTKWRHCPVCQARIKSEGLKADDEFTAEEKLQSYAIRRMEGILAKYGRKLIGWDEILEGGLSDGAAVMSWRGESGGIKAAATNHNVVMTPSRAGMYFDHYQGDSKVEPVTIGNLNTLEKVYNYDPVPASLAKQGKGDYVMGVQCNNWSEYMYDEAKREYMLFPRAFALAEIAWTPLERKDFGDFLERMDAACQRLDKAGVVYHIPIPEQPGGSCDNLAFIDKASVEFTTTRPMKMVYTLDGSEPTAESAEYTEALTFTESATLKIACLTNYGKLGPVRTVSVSKQAPRAAPAGWTAGSRLRRPFPLTQCGRLSPWRACAISAPWRNSTRICRTASSSSRPRRKAGSRFRRQESTASIPTPTACGSTANLQSTTDRKSSVFPVTTSNWLSKKACTRSKSSIFIMWWEAGTRCATNRT